MNFRKKVISVGLILVLAPFVFSGCGFSSIVKKASKGLTSYAISAVFCDEEKSVSAVEKINYVNNVDTILETVCFHLYGKAFSEEATIKPYSTARQEECFPNGINYGDMQITSVMVDGSTSDYTLIGEDSNILEVNLLEPLFEGESVDITIEFDLMLANCTHRLGYIDNTVNLGNWYPIACKYENGQFVMDAYFSNGDPFFSDCASYEVTFSYPSKYVLSSTGTLISSSEESEIRTDVYSALAVRDFAMCMATNWVCASSEVGKTIVNVYAYDGDSNIETYLKTASRSVEYFNEIFGVYPYETLDVVFTNFYQGGMEYPNLVYISDLVSDQTELKKVIVHEIAHQWWYGIVGNNEVVDAWFDEGLAEYSTLLYFEHFSDEGVTRESIVGDTITNYELYLDVIKSLNVEINYSMELPLDEYNSEYEYVYMIYVKGLLFFENLRNTIGDDTFFDFLSELYKEYRFKIVDKESFIAVLHNSTSLDLEEYVESWLSGKTDISQN